MSKQPPDFSFEREGRPLADWLLDLVSEEAPARLRAGEALQAMMYGVPSVHTDWADIDWGPSRADIAEQGERFQVAVRTAAGSPGFPTADFVRRLIAYRIAVKEDWHRRVDKVCQANKTSSVYEQRLLQRIETAREGPERVEAFRRYLRLICASLARDCKRDQAVYEGAESVTCAGLMAAAVFRALDEALLTDRPSLRTMLDDTELFGHAADALARIGPPAVDFAGFFLDRLDAQKRSRWFDGAQALGSIGRNDPAVIDALLSRLRSGPECAQSAAAETLGHVGPPLAGRLEIALDLLLGASHSPALVHAATPALASVGRDRPEALRRVLELTAARPPRWRTDPSFPDYPCDEVRIERGVAIAALAYFRSFADQVVPALVDAFDSFAEYDPDMTYQGEHERVCDALRTFGPDAAPAVPRLVLYLDEWQRRPESEREWPKDVLVLLAAIGPAAAAALPTLKRLRTTQAEAGEPPSDTLDPDYPLDRAILALQSHV
jgi:hypothetical protein